MIFLTRLVPIPALLLISACVSVDAPTAQVPAAGNPIQTESQIRVTPTNSAGFASYPSDMFDDFQARCTQSGDIFQRPYGNEFRCISLPTPEEAAALILQNNGSVEDIPRYVSGFVVNRSQDNGYLVQAVTYILVPGRDGGDVRIEPTGQDRREIVELLKAYLTNFGGTVL